MKILTALNLLDASGRLNLIHVFCYASLTYLFTSHSTVSLIAFCVSCSLLGLELWKVPQPKNIQFEGVEKVKEEVDRVAKDLRSLNLKLGFRQ